jgi:micrococcal nuclease
MIFLLLATLCAEPAQVERVVDGDTVVVRLDGSAVKVRLIGVDAPESVEPRKPVERFARESSAFLRKLVDGKRVRLAYEPSGARIERYGRTLAYLYLEPGGVFVNREMIAKGFGHAYTAYPFAYLDDFRQAERVARKKGLGLWGPDSVARDEVVYFTKTRTKYHRAGCRFLDALAPSAGTLERRSRQLSLPASAPGCHLRGAGHHGGSLSYVNPR